MENETVFYGRENVENDNDQKNIVFSLQCCLEFPLIYTSYLKKTY